MGWNDNKNSAIQWSYFKIQFLSVLSSYLLEHKHGVKYKYSRLPTRERPTLSLESDLKQAILLIGF